MFVLYTRGDRLPFQCVEWLKSKYIFLLQRFELFSFWLSFNIWICFCFILFIICFGVTLTLPHSPSQMNTVYPITYARGSAIVGFYSLFNSFSPEKRYSFREMHNFIFLFSFSEYNSSFELYSSIQESEFPPIRQIRLNRGWYNSGIDFSNTPFLFYNMDRKRIID